MYKAPPAHALTEEFYETDPRNDFARGFAIQTVGPLPIAFAKQMMAAKERLGLGAASRNDGLQPLGRASASSARSCPGPTTASNSPRAPMRKTIRPARGPRHVRPPRERQEADQGRQEQGHGGHAGGGRHEVVQEAATPTWSEPPAWHNPDAGVCDKFGRTWDIPNLFIMDGSVMPTQGSANPGLTIQALAARTADYLISQNKNLLARGHRDPDTTTGAQVTQSTGYVY